MRRYCGTLLIVVSILTAAVPCDSQPARARFTPVSDATLLDPTPPTGCTGGARWTRGGTAR